VIDQLKRCIFCRSHDKLTSEHIFGEWTKRYLPKTHNKHDFQDVKVPLPGVHEYSQKKIRAGDPILSHVRVVCGSCNSGWMSDLQNRAIPVLTPLFEGRFENLDVAAQTTLAAWSAMATMTSEFLARDPQKIVVTQAERWWLKDNLTAPSNWRIWIGRYKRKTWGGQWVRVTLPIRTAEEIQNGEISDLRTPNIQTVTFIVGELYVTVLSAPQHLHEIVDLWDWRTAARARNRLQQIWPIMHLSVLGAPPPITDDDAESFATAFKRWNDEIGKKTGAT